MFLVFTHDDNVMLNDGRVSIIVTSLLRHNVDTNGDNKSTLLHNKFEIT